MITLATSVDDGVQDALAAGADPHLLARHLRDLADELDAPRLERVHDDARDYRVYVGDRKIGLVYTPRFQRQSWRLIGYFAGHSDPARRIYHTRKRAVRALIRLDALIEGSTR